MLKGKRWVKVKCNYCGFEFDRSYGHLRRKSNKLCPNCYFGEDPHSYHRDTIDSFRKKCINKGITYKIPDQPYINSLTTITAICPKHGKFPITPNNLLRGRKCPDCSKEKQSIRQRKSIAEVVRSINKSGNNEYEWVWGEYKNENSYLYFRHNACHNVFGMIYSQFISKQNIGHIKCDLCRETNSIGERIIFVLLSMNYCKFDRQYPIDVSDNQKLYIDFTLHINNSNYAIEYDGEQHFKPIKYFGGVDRYNTQCTRDHKKDNWCYEHGYTLIRVPYTKRSPYDIYSYINNYVKTLSYDKSWNFMGNSKKEIADYAVSHKSNKAAKNKYKLSETTITSIVKSIYGNDMNLCTYDRDRVNGREVVGYYLSHTMEDTCKKFGIKRHLVFSFAKQFLGCTKSAYLKKAN